MQDQSNTEKITELLRQYQSENLKFEDAEEKLKNLGYSDEKISLVADDFDYDEKPPTPDINKVAEQYFEKHPNQTVKDGDDLIKAQHKEEVKDDRTQAILDITASVASPRLGAAPTDLQIKYQSKFASDIGMSFWVMQILFLLINVVAIVLALYFKLNSWFYLINIALFIAMVTLLIRVRIK